MLQLGAKVQLNVLDDSNKGAPHVAVNYQAVGNLDSSNAFEGSKNFRGWYACYLLIYFSRAGKIT